MLIDEVWEDGSATFRGRFGDEDASFQAEGTPWTRSDYSAISYSVFDKLTKSVVTDHNAVALTISAIIFDTLQGWGKDAVGYNFRHTVAPSAFPTGGLVYVVEYKLEMTSGNPGWAVAEVLAKSVMTS